MLPSAPSWASIRWGGPIAGCRRLLRSGHHGPLFLWSPRNRRRPATPGSPFALRAGLCGAQHTCSTTQYFAHPAVRPALQPAETRPGPPTRRRAARSSTADPRTSTASSRPRPRPRCTPPRAREPGSAARAARAAAPLHAAAAAGLAPCPRERPVARWAAGARASWPRVPRSGGPARARALSRARARARPGGGAAGAAATRAAAGRAPRSRARAPPPPPRQPCARCGRRARAARPPAAPRPRPRPAAARAGAAAPWPCAPTSAASPRASGCS